MTDVSEELVATSSGSKPNVYLFRIRVSKRRRHEFLRNFGNIYSFDTEDSTVSLDDVTWVVVSWEREARRGAAFQHISTWS